MYRRTQKAVLNEVYVVQKTVNGLYVLNTGVRAGLTIRGPHTNLRRGPFSCTRSQDFLICGCGLFPKKVDDLF